MTHRSFFRYIQPFGLYSLGTNTVFRRYVTSWWRHNFTNPSVPTAFPIRTYLIYPPGIIILWNIAKLSFLCLISPLGALQLTKMLKKHFMLCNCVGNSISKILIYYTPYLRQNVNFRANDVIKMTSWRHMTSTGKTKPTHFSYKWPIDLISVISFSIYLAVWAVLI